ncbi:replication-associated recombination protein A [Helicobacter sp. T3_23-1056]
MTNLALSLRPKNLQDFVGQSHIFGSGKPLYEALKSKKLPHCFFYGTPGSGKTTLARIIASELGSDFLEFNATDFKLESLRVRLKPYKDALIIPLIFIDEVHRLSKTQQEALLPIMEERRAIVLGASTQNPFYTLTNAIRSRSMLFEFKPLKNFELEHILTKALETLEIYIAESSQTNDSKPSPKSNANSSLKYAKSIDKDAFSYIISSSAGDARAMLNLLEVLALSPKITLENAKALRPFSLNDGASEDDTHYNLASALIKSIRGSDVNASIYYLARLITGGENPEFIARRLVILASEDIGNANPNALNLATSTLIAVGKIGYPEARIILSQCVIFLASCPKSNTAYKAIDKAIEAINDGEILPISPHILPHSKSYKYPHNFGGWVEQKYLTKDLHFVESTAKGYEKTLNEWLEKIKQSK